MTSCDFEPRGLRSNMGLAALQKKIVNCKRCPRLVLYQQQVAQQKVRRFREEVYWGKPVPSFGDTQARVLVIGLAPGAHGANRTGRAFTGDRSGMWLYDALYAYGFANQPQAEHRQDGLRLKDCYITQVIHCAPPGNKPTREEIMACHSYLLAELQLLINLQVVISLGRIAFDACLRVCREMTFPLPAPLPRFGHGQVYALANKVTLVSSYHPSQQNTQTGRLSRAEFHAIFETVRSLLC